MSLLAVLAVAACANSPLSPTGDGPAGGDAGGGGNDLAATGSPDLAAATCMDVSAAVQQYLDGNAACQRDTDCREITTRCGLPGVCGAYLHKNAVAGLDSLEHQWDLLKCLGPCPPCRAPDEAACVQGRCQAVGQNDRPVGASCFSSGSCHSEGQYASTCQQSASFSGGYCTLPCAHGFGCPLPDELCRVAAIDNTKVMACFRQCSDDSDCRSNAGYRCCPTWMNAGGSPGSVCFPAPCPM